MPLDFPNNPATNATYSSGGYTWRFDGTRWKVAPSTNPTYQTTLPSSPVDGQEIYYQASGAMTTQGIVWHLRYRSAARSNAGAWEFMGGPEIRAGFSGSRTITVNNTWYALTSGPSITIPRAGQYKVSFGAAGGQSVSAVNPPVGFVNVSKNGASPTAYEAKGTYQTYAVTYARYYHNNTFTDTYATNDALTLQVRCEFGGAGFDAGISEGRIEVVPDFLNPA